GARLRRVGARGERGAAPAGAAVLGALPVRERTALARAGGADLGCAAALRRPAGRGVRRRAPGPLAGLTGTRREQPGRHLSEAPEGVGGSPAVPQIAS